MLHPSCYFLLLFSGSCLFPLGSICPSSLFQHEPDSRSMTESRTESDRWCPNWVLICSVGKKNSQWKIWPKLLGKCSHTKGKSEGRRWLCKTEGFVKLTKTACKTESYFSKFHDHTDQDTLVLAKLIAIWWKLDFNNVRACRGFVCLFKSIFNFLFENFLRPLFCLPPTSLSVAVAISVLVPLSS